MTFTVTSILTAGEGIEYHEALIVMYLPDATPRDLPDKVLINRTRMHKLR